MPQKGKLAQAVAEEWEDVPAPGSLASKVKDEWEDVPAMAPGTFQTRKGRRDLITPQPETQFERGVSEAPNLGVEMGKGVAEGAAYPLIHPAETLRSIGEAGGNLLDPTGGALTALVKSGASATRNLYPYAKDVASWATSGRSTGEELPSPREAVQPVGMLLGARATEPAVEASGRLVSKVRAFAPETAPGLSAEATANLAEPIARRGVENVFRSAGPGTAKGDLALREQVSLAAPDLAKMQRTTPLQTKGGIVRPDFRMREAATNVEQYGSQMYELERKPQITRHGGAQVDLQPVKQQIRSSLSRMDAERNPAKVQAVEDRLSRMPDFESLSELDQRYHQVNAERRAFRRMTDSEQFAARQTNPAIDAIDTEHDAVQDAIGRTLERYREPGVRDFDRRYSALSSVSDDLAKRMNAAEQERGLHKVRGIGRSSLIESIFGPPSSGRLVGRGLKQLAKSGLEPPEVVPRPPQLAGFLPPGVTEMPPGEPSGPSFVRGVPGQYARIAPERGLPAWQEPVVTPPPGGYSGGPYPEGSEPPVNPPGKLIDAIRSVQRDPRTGRMRRVYLGGGK